MLGDQARVNHCLVSGIDAWRWESMALQSFHLVDDGLSSRAGVTITSNLPGMRVVNGREKLQVLGGQPTECCCNVGHDFFSRSDLAILVG